MIKTVGDLIQKLEKYDSNAPVRMIVKQGVLDGVYQVRDIAGKIALIPGSENSRSRGGSPNA